MASAVWPCRWRCCSCGSNAAPSTRTLPPSTTTEARAAGRSSPLLGGVLRWSGPVTVRGSDSSRCRGSVLLAPFGAVLAPGEPDQERVEHRQQRQPGREVHGGDLVELVADERQQQRDQPR